MSQLKLRAKIDQHGVLTAKLPKATAGLTVEVVVDLPEKDSESEESFLSLLASSFGSMPDLVKPEQGELPQPASWQ